MYLYGQGVDQDTFRAWHYCVEPAKAGNSSSMVMLAEMAEKEEIKIHLGEQQAINLALNFYKMAADRGHAHGQFKLGYFYENGIGTVVDLEKAKLWYEASEQQDHIGAKKALKSLIN